MLPFLNVLHPRQVNARKATPFSLPPVPPSIRCVELRSAPGFPSSRAVPLAARCPLPPHTASRALHSRTRDSVRANARTRRATVAGPALPRGSRLPPSLAAPPSCASAPPRSRPGAAPAAGGGGRASYTESRAGGGVARDRRSVPRGQVSGAQLRAEDCAGRGGSGRAAAFRGVAVPPSFFLALLPLRVEGCRGALPVRLEG